MCIIFLIFGCVELERTVTNVHLNEDVLNLWLKPDSIDDYV
jgi:hypothetical protein